MIDAKRLEEIERRLNTVTPGRWSALTPYAKPGRVMTDQTFDNPAYDSVIANDLSHADAEFIAAAPDDIHFLLQWVKLLEAELVIHREHPSFLMTTLAVLSADERALLLKVYREGPLTSAMVEALPIEYAARKLERLERDGLVGHHEGLWLVTARGHKAVRTWYYEEQSSASTSVQEVKRE